MGSDDYEWALHDPLSNLSALMLNHRATALRSHSRAPTTTIVFHLESLQANHNSNVCRVGGIGTCR